MDGFTATRQLRLRGLKTPIIALTAHAMKGFEEEIMAVGFSGYLTKPIDIDEMIHKLADLLRARSVDADHSETQVERAVNDVEANATPVAETPLVSRLVASNPRFQPIVEKFVRRLAGSARCHVKGLGGKKFRGASKPGALAQGRRRNRRVRCLH